MSGQLIKFHTNGDISYHPSTARGSWPLKMAQELVGGYVERTRVRVEGKIRDCLVDEDGLAKQLPLNLRFYNHTGTSLLGPVLVWIPDPSPRKARS